MNDNALRITVTVGAILLSGAHLWLPSFHLDNVTIVLLVIAVLPWLRSLVKSVEIPGLKIELQELKAEVSEAKGAAQSAKHQANYAELVATAASTDLSAAAAATERVSGVGSGKMAKTFEALTEEYEAIRAREPASDSRTIKLTDVVRRMIDAINMGLTLDVHEKLLSDRTGYRIFAYAWLYTKPDPRWLEPLVQSLTAKEDTGNGQYWGIRALGRVVAEATAIPSDMRGRLQAFASRLERGTDLDYELTNVLRQIR